MVLLEKKIAGLSVRSLDRFLLRARRAVGVKGRLNVLVTGNAAMRRMNSEFRGKNTPTDVLSFPAGIGASRVTPKSRIAGEIAISAEIARDNAARFGHAAAEEIKLLTLHGILHLAGYDHERDNGRMARKEAKLRRQFRLPDSLTERGQPHLPEGPGRNPSRSRSKRSTA